jgi:EAL domain-containing protein (putative c-di-GMP-specific phosphodiesterase class I)/AmiR/NasT family two-component response regulator
MHTGAMALGGSDIEPRVIGSLLVVDDNPVQRMQVTALCRDMGIPVLVEAASGTDALGMLASGVPLPDLMIVDLEMPQMDGVELIERMHQHGMAIPLVVLSNRETVLIDTVHAMARNLGLPVLAAIRKPLRRETLEAALRSWHPDLTAMRAGEARTPDRPLAPGQLGDAIAAGDIIVHYQPKVDMTRGELCGVEALARWNHATLGDIRPDRFIGVAEREGLIHDLSLSVIEQAFADAARWNAQGLHLSLAVNLSPLMLQDAALVGELSTLLERHRLDARQVVLEITESSVVDFMGVALGVLARLRLKGFGLSIDDYGTGFSSMQQLARIPFSELKIDRAFVHGAHERTNLRVILQSALDMSRQLGLTTVAEGVETEEDWRLVKDSGCRVGQGFLLAPALPADQLVGWSRSEAQRLKDLG